MQQRSNSAQMNTLSACINKLVSEGYTTDFKVDEKGLTTTQNGKHFKPDEVHIKNFFRFEGESDPADSSILYAIELDDGTKGTLTDAYGSNDDPFIGKFIKQVEDIEKKTAKKDQ
jgi:hypothetical protein